MCSRSASLRVEDVVVEQAGPGVPEFGRHRPDVQQAVEEAVHRRRRPLDRPERAAPPVVDENIERTVERLHVVPPQCRNEKRIAGSKLSDAGRGERILEPGKFSRFGSASVHHAHCGAGRGEVERTHIEVGDLFRRKQGEPAPSSDDAGEVLRLVEVGRHRDAVADPDPRHDGRIEDRKPVFRGKARQAVRNQGALYRDGRRVLELRVARQLFEDRGNRQAVPDEVEPIQGVVVRDSPTRRRRHQDGVDGIAIVEAGQGNCRISRALPAPPGRPASP